MALTVTKTRILEGPADVGGKRTKMMIGSIDFDSSYPTGGEALDLSGDFDTLHLVFFEAAPIICKYDYTNKKVLAYWFDYDGSADAIAIQVADTTDLSAQTGIKFIAWGE